MSSFQAKFRNKKTGLLHLAMCIDDYYGRHQYGYLFRGLYKEPLTEEELDEEWERVFDS